LIVRPGRGNLAFMTHHTRIAVIETRWSRTQNVSVRPLFDLLSESWCAHPHGYHYEMVGSAVAAREAVARVAADPRCRAVYLATHGVAAGLALHNGEALAVADLAQSLARSSRPADAPLHGVYLSACGIGTRATASALLGGKTGQTTPIQWFAGYDRDVDWIDTLALEMLFFNAWIRVQENNTPGRAIEIVAEKIARKAGGLVAELGFRLYARQGAEVVELPGGTGSDPLRQRRTEMGV
jgi:hypothetical protein